MSELGFTIFHTAVGSCGIVWSERGIVRVLSFESSDRSASAHLRRRHPKAREAVPPDALQRVIDDIVGLLGGEPRDLNHATLDMVGCADFHRRVYEIARTIPAGSTLTYGEIAERLGDRILARDVGEALSRNPWPIIVPCHRVLAAGGKTGGFSAPGGVATKLRLLSIEGAQPGGPTLFDHLPLVAPQRRRATTA
jgi:methylated-DNA-[protein]-cysteine S-methyltransferase